MGKFDDVIKFLGKEDTVPPETIEQTLNNAGGVMPAANVSSDEVSEESLANIDALLNSNFPNFASSDVDELSEIPVQGASPQPAAPVEDATFPDLAEVPAPPAGDESFPDLDEFKVDVGSEPVDFSAQDENAAQEESSPDEDFNIADTGASQAPTPHAAVPAEEDIDLDNDTLQELSNLDSAPPPIEDIHLRASQANQDLIADMLEEQKQGSAEEPFDVDFEVEQSAPDFDTEAGESPQIPVPAEEEPVSSEMSDLLKEFTAEQPKKTTEEHPSEFDIDHQQALPEEGLDTGMGDLQDLMGGMDLGTPEPAQPEPSGGGMDFDLEPSGEMAGGDEFTDLMASADAEEQNLKEESFQPETGENAGTGMEDFSIPDFGEPEGAAEPETSFGAEPALDESFPDVSFEPEPSGGEPEIPELSEEPAAFEAGPEPDFSMDTGPEPDFGAADEVSAVEPEPARETRRPSFERPSLQPSEPLPDLEMDTEKAVKIRAHINRMKDPLLRKKLRKAILDNFLPPNVLERLLAMLLLEDSEANIAAFVEQNFPKDISYEEETPAEPEKPLKMGRRVIHTEEAKRSQAFAKELQNVTRYAALAFILLVVLGFVFWRFIFKPTMAARHYNAGIAAISVNAYDKAEQEFLEGQNIGGPDVKWYDKFALAYLDERQFARAEEKFKKALEIDPSNVDTILSYAEYYRKIFPPQYEKAINLYTVLSKKKPDEFNYLNLIGKTYTEWGDSVKDPDEQLKLYDAASAVYTQYLIKDPKHILSYMHLLQLALRVKNEQKIDMMYDTIDKLNPNAIDPEIFTELAAYYVDMRKLDKAKNVFQKLNGYIDERIAAFNRRRGHRDINKDEKILFGESYFQYARYLSVNMDFQRAITAASNATILDPHNGRAYNLLGEIFYFTETMNNHIETAKGYFEIATNYAPTYFKPYANLGHIYYYQNLSFDDPDLDRPLRKALQNYTIARTLLPQGQKDFLLEYNLAWLYYHYNNYESAFEQWSDLYVDNTGDPILSYALGNTYYHMNQPNLAETEYDKAIAYYQKLADNIPYINPNLDRHIEIYSQLSRSYNNRGVIYALAARADPRRKAYFENLALLDFQRSKNEMNRISQINPYAEANIKYILDPGIRGRLPTFDDYIPKRTSLQKWVDEFRENLIETI